MKVSTIVLPATKFGKNRAYLLQDFYDCRVCGQLSDRYFTGRIARRTNAGGYVDCAVVDCGVFHPRRQRGEQPHTKMATHVDRK